MAKESSQKKVELAQALTTDSTNTSTTATKIQGISATSGSVSYTHQDLVATLENDDNTTNTGYLFHTHIQGLNHANVHSLQDEHQHSVNAQRYTQNSTAGDLFTCLGNGIIGVRNDGGFSIKARSTSNDLLVTFSYQGIQAEELVFDKQRNLVGMNRFSTLDPTHNTGGSWNYQAV